jgi:glycosyltransferase involved in cell wall biosynthesis
LNASFTRQTIVGLKISIITVVYNGAAYIADAIRSVLGQDYPHVEYIVVDGNSRDNTVDIINSFASKIDHFVSEPDNGIYDAMNKGLALASGDIVGILNADDIYANCHILSQVARKFQTTACEALYGDLVYVEANQVDRIVRYWKTGEYYQGAFVDGWMPPHPTFFVRRGVYERLGNFNTSLRTAADYELMLRFMYVHQINVAYLPQVMIKMREGGASNATLKGRLLAHQEDRKAWQLNNRQPKFYTLYLKPLKKIKQYFLRPKTV